MFLDSRTQEEEHFIVLKNKADILYEKEDYSSAANVYSQIIDKTTNKTINTKLIANLASCLSVVNINKNNENIVSLYKKVINDFTIPALARALILNDLGDFLFRQSPDFIYSHFSSQSPFDVFFKSNDIFFDKDYFFVELYKYSDEIFENSLAKINLAFVIARMINRGLYGDGVLKEENAEKALSLVFGADRIIKNISYESTPLIKQYFYKSVVLQMCHNKIKKPEISIVEESYLRALAESLKSNSDNVLVLRMSIRIHLAEFLRRFKGVRKEEWEPYLEKIYDQEEGQREVIKKQFQERVNKKDTVYYRKAIINLSEESLNFNNYLIAIGCSL